jgi:hypothetical protein
MDMQAPAGGNIDRGPQAIAIFWAEAAIALIVVVLRIWGRAMIHQLGADDYIMVFTLVSLLSPAAMLFEGQGRLTPRQILFLILSAFITYYATIGGLRHLFYLEPEEQALVVKYNWITQPWCIFGFATGKISVALLILRLIGPNTFWRKWTLYGSMITVFIFNVLACILTFVQCDPPRALWEPQLIATGQAKCWDSRIQSDYAIFSTCK